ncbi:MAG TPA: hypothetical protein DCZ95_09335 [Verrucomicrobia bacterium]|nr:MAG: hypothetical protein A2X46_06400 [Lentisphaerae bacterium GWF2_57_35]HBA84281.1 hypothetical protein [Verrucomicrobiota bacterium]
MIQALTREFVKRPMKSLASTQIFSYLTHNHNLNRNPNLFLDKKMEIMIKIRITIMRCNQNGILPT